MNLIQPIKDTHHLKTHQLRLDILKTIIEKGSLTISDLSRYITLSIPTITKMIGEMVETGLLYESGKSDNHGARKASLFDINHQAGYFIGIDVKKNKVICVVCNFIGGLLQEEQFDFWLDKSEECYPSLLRIIRTFIGRLTIPMEKIITLGICVPGRVNSNAGIAYSFFYSEQSSLAKNIEEEFNIPVVVENDTRAATYGEFICGAAKSTENALFVNITWGLGVGIIVDKKIYYGKSGYSGEYGHLPAFDNEILCHCGKKGCLETEVSGSAIVRKFKEECIKGSSTVLQEKAQMSNPELLSHILDAAKREDLLSLEIIDRTGRLLGKYIAGLLNVFNPEVIVLGGEVGTLGRQIQLPVETGIMKHTLSFVNNDTELRIAKLKEKAGSIGVCMLSRNKILGIIRHS